ncbi:MAG: YitT family protein [Clostridia bacterium]|nr:YitT family protein [Clostridia bacterium]
MNYLKSLNWKRISKDIAYEIVGSFLIAIALYNFAVKAEFPMTGFSGLALIAYRLWGMPIGVTTALLNVPVAILCYRLLGKGFFLRSLRCIVISTVLIDYVAPLLPVYEGERLLAALCTGIIGGLGYALIYVRNSSTGGSDFIIMAIKAIKPHLEMSRIIFISDAFIVLLGGFIFKDMDGVIYGFIINYFYGQMIDQLLLGLNSGKLALIVTAKADEMAALIDRVADRGSTIIHAHGGYTKQRRDVVMCACNSKQLYQTEKAIKDLDPESFMVILNSHEVLGEGFQVTRIAS